MRLVLMVIMVCVFTKLSYFLTCKRLGQLRIELGPFRRTCEITLSLLRQNEDALMTILETFLYDPTTDFIGKKVSFAPIQNGFKR
jgi:hypothetical protein